MEKTIARARNLAATRGHKIGAFRMSRLPTGPTPAGGKECLVGVCEYCGAVVAVNMAAPTGSAAIFGDAVAQDCPGEVFI